MPTILNDVSTTPETIQQLIAQANHQIDTCESDQIKLDLSFVTEVRSKMLGQLVRLHLRAQRCDANLVLENVDPSVLEVLALTRLDRMLRIRTDPAHQRVANHENTSRIKRSR